MDKPQQGQGTPDERTQTRKEVLDKLFYNDELTKKQAVNNTIIKNLVKDIVKDAISHIAEKKVEKPPSRMDFPMFYFDSGDEEDDLADKPPNFFLDEITKKNLLQEKEKVLRGKASKNLVKDENLLHGKEKVLRGNASRNLVKDENETPFYDGGDEKGNQPRFSPSDDSSGGSDFSESAPPGAVSVPGLDSFVTTSRAWSSTNNVLKETPHETHPAPPAPLETITTLEAHLVDETTISTLRDEDSIEKIRQQVRDEVLQDVVEAERVDIVMDLELQQMSGAVKRSESNENSRYSCKRWYTIGVVGLLFLGGVVWVLVVVCHSPPDIVKVGGNEVLVELNSTKDDDVNNIPPVSGANDLAGACGVGFLLMCPQTGPCCSEFNFCGRTDAHCGARCQVDFSGEGACHVGNSTPPSSHECPPSSTTRCGLDWADANGKCGLDCSEFASSLLQVVQQLNDPCSEFGEICYADLSQNL
jgi:hypothetical protein